MRRPRGHTNLRLACGTMVALFVAGLAITGIMPPRNTIGTIVFEVDGVHALDRLERPLRCIGTHSEISVMRSSPTITHVLDSHADADMLSLYSGPDRRDEMLTATYGYIVEDYIVHAQSIIWGYDPAPGNEDLSEGSTNNPEVSVTATGFLSGAVAAWAYQEPVDRQHSEDTHIVTINLTKSPIHPARRTRIFGAT